MCIDYLFVIQPVLQELWSSPWASFVVLPQSVWMLCCLFLKRNIRIIILLKPTIPLFVVVPLTEFYGVSVYHHQKDAPSASLKQNLLFVPAFITFSFSADWKTSFPPVTVSAFSCFRWQNFPPPVAFRFSSWLNALRSVFSSTPAYPSALYPHVFYISLTILSF